MGHCAVKCAATNISITRGECYAGFYKLEYESDYVARLEKPFIFGSYSGYRDLEGMDGDERPNVYLHPEVYNKMKTVWLTESGTKEPTIRKQSLPHAFFLEKLGFELTEELEDNEIRYDQVYRHPERPNITIFSDGTWVNVDRDGYHVTDRSFYTLQDLIDFINEGHEDNIDNTYFDEQYFVGVIDESIKKYEYYLELFGDTPPLSERLKDDPEAVARHEELEESKNRIKNYNLNSAFRRLGILLDDSTSPEKMVEYLRTEEGKRCWSESLLVWMNLRVANTCVCPEWLDVAGCQDGALAAERYLHNIAGEILTRLEGEEKENNELYN